MCVHYDDDVGAATSACVACGEDVWGNSQFDFDCQYWPNNLLRAAKAACGMDDCPGAPSEVPTPAPSPAPTPAPSALPTPGPTATKAPSMPPTPLPTMAPTVTSLPTLAPSFSAAPTWTRVAENGACHTHNVTYKKGALGHEVPGPGSVRLGKTVEEAVLPLQGADDGHRTQALAELSREPHQQHVPEAHDIGPSRLRHPLHQPLLT